LAPVGLKNPKNSCFMNSILQCLLVAPLFNEYLLKTFPGEQHARPTPISCAYIELLQKVRQGQLSSAHELKSQFSKSVAMFAGEEEEDA